MNRKNRIAQVVGITVFASLCSSGPAAAQAWIGQIVGNMMAQQQAAAAQAACMRGTPPPESERVEALGPARAKIGAYYAAMQLGTGARSDYFALDKRAAWTHGANKLGETDLDTLPEPFAAQGLAIDAEPIGFVRSGLDGTALGQWAVRDGNGQVTGVYSAFFVRQLGEWKLRTLTLEDTADYSGPVDQFCHAPGDVLPYRLANATRLQEFYGKRLAKAEAKLASARAGLAKAEAGLAEKPDSSQRQLGAEKARELVAKWEREEQERRTGLETARADEKSALAEQEAMSVRRAKAREDLGMTGAEAPA